MSALLLAALLFALPPHTHRSREVRREFQRVHPCPSTGLRTGACPGYVVDHRIALCVGGPDSVENMQWQTVEAAREKDRTECKLKKSTRD